jgi:hypothetical protein
MRSVEICAKGTEAPEPLLGAADGEIVAVLTESSTVPNVASAVYEQ